MEYLQYILYSLIGLAITFSWGFTSKKFMRNHKENEALKHGMKALLKAQILDYYEKFVEFKGFMPIVYKNVLTEMFKEYKTLGGNGTAEEMYNVMMKLPTSIKTKKGNS